MKQLQDEARHLRKEVESLEGKLQFQMENNQALSLLSKEQKEKPPGAGGEASKAGGEEVAGGGETM